MKNKKSIIEKRFAKVKQEMDKEISQRLTTEILPSGIVKETHNYFDPKQKMNELNVYYPQGTSKPLPLIIDIHGGGWVSGDKELNRNFCMHLSKYNFVVISMSYRLCVPHTIYDQIIDLFCCYRYIIIHAHEMFIDLNRIYLSGDSAGGMLALFTYAIMQNKRLQDGLCMNEHPFFKQNLKMVIHALQLNHPVPYMHSINLTKNKIINRIAIKFLLKLFVGNKKTFLYKNVSFEDYEDLIEYPPIFIVSSEGDKHFKEQSFRLYKDLKQKGSLVEFNFNKNSKLEHVYNVIYPDKDEALIVNKEIIDFFNKY